MSSASSSPRIVDELAHEEDNMTKMNNNEDTPSSEAVPRPVPAPSHRPIVKFGPRPATPYSGGFFRRPAPPRGSFPYREYNNVVRAYSNAKCSLMRLAADIPDSLLSRRPFPFAEVQEVLGSLPIIRQARNGRIYPFSPSNTTPPEEMQDEMSIRGAYQVPTSNARINRMLEDLYVRTLQSITQPTFVYMTQEHHQASAVEENMFQDQTHQPHHESASGSSDKPASSDKPEDFTINKQTDEEIMDLSDF